MSDVIGTRLRWELLHFAIATIEATWVYVWVQALVPADGPLLGLGWLLLYAFAMITWSRFLLHSERWEDHRRKASLTAALVAMIVVAQLAFAPYVGLLSLGNLAELLLAPWYVITGTLTPFAVAGGALLVLWFRMIHITQEPLTFHFTAYRFRLGVLFLLGGLLIDGARGASVSTSVIFLYFGAGLLAIALARAEQVSGAATGENELPFTMRWVGTLAGVLVLTLLAGWLVTQGLASGRLSALADFFSPVTFVIQRLFYYAALAVFYALTPLINALINLLRAGEFEPPEFDQPAEPEFDQNQLSELFSPAWADNPVVATVLDLLPVVIVAMVVLWVAWRLQRSQEQRRTDEAATRESVAVEGQGLGLGDLFHRGRRTLDEFLRRVTPRGWFATETVEDLYRNLLLWGARRGTPRAADETPYEYMHTLRDVAGHRFDDVRRLTDAYVDSRYGSHRVSREEIVRLRESWERLSRSSVDEEG